MKNGKLKALLVVVVLALAACGDEAPPSDDKLVKTEITGVAFMAGLEADASVKVFGFDSGEKGSMFGFSVTNQNGTWAVELGSKHGDLLVEVEANGLTMKRLLPEVEPGATVTDVTVTPVTTLSTSLAEYYLSYGVFESVGDAREYADALVFGHFGNLDHGRIVPVPFGSGIEELSQEAIAGLLIEALAMQAIKIKSSANMSEFVGLLSEDIGADGLFDGTGRGGKLAMVTYELSGDTLRPEYARYIAGFLSSPNNQSGFGLPELEDLVTALAENESAIFPGRPGDMDWKAPDMDILEPDGGAAVSGVIHVIATAWDESGEALVKPVSPEGLEIGFNGSQWLGSLDTTRYEEGPLEITLEAVDRYGNRVSDSVTVDVRNHGELAGVVFKGLVSGARIEAYDFDAGAVRPMAATDTDEHGSFKLDLGGFSGTVLLVATTGSYIEEALGTEVELARGEYLSAVVPEYSSDFQSAVAVSPLTTWAASYAEFLAGHGVGPSEAAQTANNALEGHFGIDVLGTLPVDLLAGEGCDTLTDRVKYSLFCAGLSQLAKEISTDSGLTPGAVVNAVTMTDALADDLGADGMFDGWGKSGRSRQGNEDLSSYTTRFELARAVNSWLGSGMNACAVSVEDFRTTADLLALDDSELYPESEPPIPMDEEPPEFTFETHDDGQPVNGIITVSVSATDNDVLAEIHIKSPPGLDAISTVDVIDAKTQRITFTMDTSTQRPDGPFTIEYRAVDRSGNEAGKYLTLFVDNTPPEFVWASPQAGQVIVTATGTVVCSGTVSDAGVGLGEVNVNGVRAQIQGNAWSSTITGLQEGQNTLRFLATDSLGNPAAENRTITINMDVQAPEITFISHQNNDWVRGTFDVVVEATDNRELTSFQILSPQVPAQLESGSPTRFRLTIHDFNSSQVADGDLAIQFQAKDGAGNTTSKTLTLKVDNTPPTVTWTKPAQGTTLHLRDPYVVECQGTVSDAALASILVQNEAPQVEGTQWTKRFAGVSAGTRTWVVRATDQAGNQSMATRTFTVVRPSDPPIDP